MKLYIRHSIRDATLDILKERCQRRPKRDALQLDHLDLSKVIRHPMPGGVTPEAVSAEASGSISRYSSRVVVCL